MAQEKKIKEGSTTTGTNPLLAKKIAPKFLHHQILVLAALAESLIIYSISLVQSISSLLFLKGPNKQIRVAICNDFITSYHVQMLHPVDLYAQHKVIVLQFHNVSSQFSYRVDVCFQPKPLEIVTLMDQL